MAKYITNIQHGGQNDENGSKEKKYSDAYGDKIRQNHNNDQNMEAKWAPEVVDKGLS